jgi:hypothetical protein
MGKTTEGQCVFCGGTFGKAAMTKHLQNCVPRRAEHVTEAVEKTESYYWSDTIKVQSEIARK